MCVWWGLVHATELPVCLQVRKNDSSGRENLSRKEKRGGHPVEDREEEEVCSAASR